jgi:hypothetical protein
MKGGLLSILIPCLFVDAIFQLKCTMIADCLASVIGASKFVGRIQGPSSN